MDKLSKADIPNDDIRRLVILERIEGPSVDVRISKTPLDGIDATVETEGSQEIADNIYEQILPNSNVDEVFREADIETLHLDMIHLPLENHNFYAPGGQLFLRELQVKPQDSEEAKWQGPITIAQNALQAIGMPHMEYEGIKAPSVRPEPFDTCPIALHQALIKQDRELAESICNDLRQKPSELGVYDYTPSYIAKLGTYVDNEDKDREWTI